jgi:hypothetical protein
MRRDQLPLSLSVKETAPEERNRGSGRGCNFQEYRFYIIYYIYFPPLFFLCIQTSTDDPPKRKGPFM